MTLLTGGVEQKLASKKEDMTEVGDYTMSVNKLKETKKWVMEYWNARPKMKKRNVIKQLMKRYNMPNDLAKNILEMV